jgi:prepilin-type processing-associated H-X9-DG protein
MRRVLILTLLGLFVIFGGGLLVVWINSARDRANDVRCRYQMGRHLFGLAHSCEPGQSVPKEAAPFYPSATLMNVDLPIDQRLSWYVTSLPALDMGPTSADPERKRLGEITTMVAKLDAKTSWSAEVNQDLAKRRLHLALCPARPAFTDDGQPQRTNYVVNGGIGEEAPKTPFEKAFGKAGAFRYDTSTNLDDIRKWGGLANLYALLETNDNPGAWLAGGTSTLRTWDGQTAPLGRGAPFGDCHAGKAYFGFCDGSVRGFTSSTGVSMFRSHMILKDERLANPGD